MTIEFRRIAAALFLLGLGYPTHLAYKYYQRCTYLPIRYPHISANGFRHTADHFFDQPHKIKILLTGKSFSPDAVKNGDTIFIKNHPQYLTKFFANVHPYINEKYILISHQGDMTTPGAYAHHLDSEKIIAWYSCNVGADAHPKMRPIPLGVMGILMKNLPRNCEEILGRVLLDIKKGAINKTNLFYFNVNPKTNILERGKPLDFLRNQKFCTMAKGKPYEQYLREMATHKFVISPHGTGLDCYRTWEALTLGCIPVVKKSSLDVLYEGLPVLIVDNWQEVTEDFLEIKYQEMQQQQYQLERLSIGYWIDVIRRHRDSLSREQENQAIQKIQN